MNSNKKAVAYLRTATGSQAQKTNILALQNEQVAQLAKLNGLDIVHTFKQMGAVDSQLYKVFDYCQKNKDVNCLIVSRLDRLGRKQDIVMLWLAAFSEIGIKIKTPTHNLPKALAQVI